MAAHTTRARTTRRPGLWGWTALILTTAGALKTWPIPAGIILGLAAAAIITHAIRPARLAPLWRALGRTTRHHTRLPDAGYRTLQNFHRMTPADFEHAIAELALEDHRVHTAHRVGGANDRGADVLVHLHDGRRILIQCKHHQPGNNVSSEASYRPSTASTATSTTATTPSSSPPQPSPAPPTKPTTASRTPSASSTAPPSPPGPTDTPPHPGNQPKGGKPPQTNPFSYGSIRKCTDRNPPTTA
jgi:hypothetical protein